MKNTRSYIFKSLIFSGIVLGTVGLNSTIVNAATNAGVDAATKTTDTAKVVNHIVFTCDDVEIGTSATTVTGDKVGQVVDITKLIPSGYQAVDGNNNLTLTENGTSQQVKLTKASDVTANVHYIYNSGVIGTETLSGLAGSTVGVKNVPEGYYLANKNQANVILGSGTSDVYLNVNKGISNTISFVTDDEAKTEVGKATVYGEKAGDSVTVNSSQLPNGYNFKDSKSATFELQPDGSRQLVTVVPAANKETLKGTVGTFDKVTPLYNEDGTEISGRALGATSDWATDTKMTLDGETYYRVSTSEWVKASDVYVYTPNEDTITTKSGAISHLYDANGKQLETRSVAADSAWYTDRTTTINGQKYYRVSTSEWLSAADLK